MKFFHKKQFKITLIIVCAIVLLLAGFLGYIYPGERIASGVYIHGTNIGRMSKKEAEEKVGRNIDCSDKIFILTDVSGQKTSFSGKDIMLSCDFTKTIEEAYGIGRSGSFLDNIVTLSRICFKPYNMGYRHSFDRALLEKVIYDFGVSVNGEVCDYTLEFADDIVTVSPGREGQKKDVSLVCDLVAEAIDREDMNISIQLEKEQPQAPFETGLVDYIYRAPVDATYTVQDGAISITDEVYGISVNPEEVKEKITALTVGEPITLALTKVNPAVTKKDLYNQLFNHTLGSYTSRYSVSNKSRTDNVVLASNMINGIILAPGDEFSYNKTLGPRTAQRGFKEAQIYANGEKIMGLGGGICQVSSTLYSAVLLSDLEVTERRSHSMTVDYVPKGQDATVSYGSIDFKFRNDTQSPIRINSTASGGVLTVSISGTVPQNEKTVKIVNNIVEVINKTTEEIPDSTLSKGERKTTDVGKIGYVVDTYKKVYENGVEVKNQYMGKSRYRMVPQKVRVGTVESEGETTPVFGETVTPTPAPEVTDSPDVTASPAPDIAQPSEAPEIPEEVKPTQTPGKRPEMNKPQDITE